MAESVNNESISAELSKTGKRSSLSRCLVALGWAAMLIFTFHACTHMVAAGDTWVAMACGRHFINHGVDTIEPFSANSHKAGPTRREIKTWPKWAQSLTDKVGLETVKRWHPTGWVNQNWLTHVMFYWLSHESPFADAAERTFNTLVYWKFAVYIFCIIFVYYTARILGAHPALAAMFSCFAMFAGRSFIDVRPAGFSNLLTAAFLLVLVLATYRSIWYIWLLVPLTVFWSNVHGGYIYAFIMLIPFIGLHLLLSLRKKWALILYNISAWPLFIAVAYKTGLTASILVFFVSLIVLDFVFIFFREKIVYIGFKNVIHTVAASVVTFIAVIIFNPFHLTNLTHTFIISVSEHAKMWRTVNEWWPAFSWTNPVGTGFPFLVMYILSIAALAFWFLSRFIQPKLLKAPKNELQKQERTFSVILKIFGWSAAMIICWAAFVSFSFVKADLAGLLLCASFTGIILLSIYKNIHFIHLIGLLTLLAIWITNAKGAGGRYIFPFVLLPSYVMTYIIASLFSKDIKFKRKNIIFPAISAVVTIILILAIFNPLKMKVPKWDMTVFSWFGQLLNNLWDIRRAWTPVGYEKNLEIFYKRFLNRHLFKMLYSINGLSIFIWTALPYLRKLFDRLPDKMQTKEPTQNHSYQAPKLDLAYMAVAALTVYMAIRSRRFIPIAGYAAGSVMAVLITQIIRTTSASLNFHKHNVLAVKPMPYKLRFFFTVTGAMVVIFFGGWVALKFKNVYLDPWPTDHEFTSVFMRMTASDKKPFHAGDFIRENNLKGKMFNYWTEGGFIGWTQNPDPDTGKTPLQLFMDGRAQAAYKPAIYKRWSQIMGGGPAGFEAALRKSKFTESVYKEMGEYISKELRRRNVWLIMMPKSKNARRFVDAIETNSEWPLIFFNDKQKIFVNIKSTEGKKLIEGVQTGETVYPDKFSKNLFLAHIYRLQDGMDAKTASLNYAIKAFNLNPSQVPMVEILSAVSFGNLRTKILKFCKNYVEDLYENMDEHRRDDAYLNKISSAMMACDYLQKDATSRKNVELARSYSSMMDVFRQQSREILNGSRW